MKMAHLIPIDLSCVHKDDYLNLWIQYYTTVTSDTQKDLLAKMNIPMTSYAYARRNGFMKSKKVTKDILDYFHLELTIDAQDFETLQELVWRAITESYFVENLKLNEIHKTLRGLKDRVKHTPLYLLYALAYLSSFDHLTYEGEDYKEMDEEVLPFLAFVKDAVSSNIEYFYLFSKTEYYFTVNKDLEAIELIPEFERLDKEVDERLKTMGYYDLFTLYAMKKNYAQALHYVDACHELCFKYYNAKRMQALRQSLTAIYFHMKDYERALKNARGDLMFLHREDLKSNKIFFKMLLVIMTASLINLERYEEALEEIENFFYYEVEDHYPQALLLKQFCLYKTNSSETVEPLLDKLKDSDIFTTEYKVLSELIQDLKEENKKTMKSFGERLKPIAENTMSTYNRIVGLLRTEYEQYLKKHNRYIDLLDMK